MTSRTLHPPLASSRKRYQIPALSAYGRLVGLLALTLALLVLYGGSVTVRAQDTDPQSLRVRETALGEILAMDLLAEERVSFSIDIAEVGRYRLMPGLLPLSDHLEVTVANAEGVPLFDSDFAAVDLTLVPGTYDIAFYARDDVTFDFVINRHFGSFTTDPELVHIVNPGDFIASRPLAQSDLYAVIVVPLQTESTEWFLQFDHQSGTSLSVTMSGREQLWEEAVTPDQPLSFWSDGGDYLLHLRTDGGDATPSLAFMQPGELDLAPLYLNSSVSGTMSPNRNQMHYRLTVDDGFVATLSLESNYAGDLDLNIHPISEPDRIVARAASPLPRETISNLLLVPDTYLITVNRAAGERSAQFELTLEVDPVETFAVVPGRTISAFQGEDSLLHLHGFHVPQEGQQITAVLQGTMRPPQRAFVFGRHAHLWEETTANPISFIAPAAGEYYMGIKTLYGSGLYALRITLAEPPPLLPATGVTTGVVQPGRSVSHRYPVPDQLDLVTFVLVSLSDQDLDLETNQYHPDRHQLSYRTSSIDPKVETVAWYDPEDGYIMVSVINYGTESSEYLLVVRPQTLDE